MIVSHLIFTLPALHSQHTRGCNTDDIYILGEVSFLPTSMSFFYRKEMGIEKPHHHRWQINDNNVTYLS